MPGGFTGADLPTTDGVAGRPTSISLRPARVYFRRR